MKCAIPTCFEYGDGSNKDISFFRFPSDEELRKKWMDTVMAMGRPIRPSARVCSKHFRNEDKSICKGGRIRLSKGAVPFIIRVRTDIQMKVDDDSQSEDTQDALETSTTAAS